MFQAPKESCSIMTVFTNSFKLYKEVFVKVLPWTIAVAILQCLGRSQDVISDTVDHGVNYSFHLPPLAIFMSCFAFLFYGCIILRIWQTLENKQVFWMQVFSQGFLRGLICLISYAVYLAILGLALFVSFWLLHFIPVIGEIVWGILSFVLIIYMSVCLLSWLPSIVSGENPIAAFKNAFKIIKGSWLSTCVLIILFTIVMIAFYYIVGLIFGQHAQIEAMQAGHTTTKDYIATAVLAIALTPWMWSLFVLQTLNLKLKHSA